MTPDFEARLKKAIDDGILPPTVLRARDKSGKINYTFSHGPATLDPALASSPPPPPITSSTLFALASMTKLLTAIAVLQLVDRGLVTLDSDIAPHLPTLAAQPVLLPQGPADPSSSSSPASGGGGAVPPSSSSRPRTRPLRLRHLLTHSSGAGYPLLSPALQAHFASAGRRPLPVPLDPAGGRTVEERFAYPLLFEPGGGWAYGCGLDWAGRLVEALTGRRLDDYLWENVLSRVGVEGRGGVTFYPGKYKYQGEEGKGGLVVAGMTVRDEATGKVVHFPMGALPGGGSGAGGGGEEEEERAALGGEGAYAAMDEYMKVLYSLLVDDGKLLRAETARLLFEPLLREPQAKQALLESVKHPGWIVGWVPDTGGEYDWSAGGLLVDGDSHPYRKRGFLQWGGMFNLSWFVDREAGVCGIYASQVAKPADPVLRPFMKEFEETIYSRL